MSWTPDELDDLLVRLKRGEVARVEVYPEGFFKGMTYGMEREVVETLVFTSLAKSLREELDGRYREEWDNRGLSFRWAATGVFEVSPSL